MSSLGDLPNPPPIPPPRVPDHELLRRIGRGAYGEVWLARSVTGAYRAVKVVHRDSFDHDRPFEREFEGILQFEPISRRHDSQVDILHVGRHGGSFYYVMELADDQVTGGQIPDPAQYQPRTLKSDLLFHGRLPFEECVRYGIALATALEELHVHRLVHRDVKPSNIIFVNGVPKLADIGLVTGVDSTRSYVGTEGFAAPEGPGTPAGDIYSLGKVLYEAATGKDRQEFPDLPTQLRELPDREGLVELNAVIAGACRHDPKDRYASAAAMRADLELLQSGKSLARLHRMEARLRWVQRFGLGLAVLAVLIAGGWLWQVRQTRRVRELVEEKSRLIEEKSKLAEENRARLVRLNVANGVRLMDQDDYSGALLWLAEALPLVTNLPAEAAIHRIRIEQLLTQSPTLVQVMTNQSGLLSGAFSPDGRRVAAGGYGNLCVWDVDSGQLTLGLLNLSNLLETLRFSVDGRRLLVATTTHSGKISRVAPGFAMVLDAVSGRPLWPPVTNLTRAVFSPDDRWLAVARADGPIEVWDAATGKHLSDLVGHTNDITMLAFSRDGLLLASASRDRTVRVWQVPSGKPALPPVRHGEAVSWVVFSPDARMLATAEDAPQFEKQAWVHTWDAATGTEIGSPILANRIVYGLSFDETGRRLLMGDDERWVRVLDPETHVALCPNLKLESSVVRCWAFSPDGQLGAFGSDDGTTRVWNLETGAPVTPRLRNVGWVESVHFSPDGTQLLITSDDGTAKVWNLASLGATRELRLAGHILEADVRLFPAAISQDGKQLLVGLGDQTFRLVHLDTMTEEGEPFPMPDGDVAGAVTFDSSGHQWAAALGEFIGSGGPKTRSVSLWREEAGHLRLIPLAHPEAVSLIQFSPDGQQLLTVCNDRRCRIWRTSDGKLLSEPAILDDRPWIVTVSPDGQHLLHVQENGRTQLLDLKQPLGASVSLTDTRGFNAARFSPDGLRLGTVSGEQCGRIWDTRTGQMLIPPFKHGGDLTWCEWSPDGQRLLTAGLAGVVKVWDARTGQPACAPLELGSYPVRVARYSPDGRFIVARNDINHQARAWDAATAEPITPFLHHTGEVRAAFIGKDNRLVTVSDPGLIRVWDLAPSQVPPSNLADYARLLAGRRLDIAGILQPLTPGEFSGLSRSLHAHQPALFHTSPELLREYHQQGIPYPVNMSAVRAGSFHLDRLAELFPDDPKVKLQQAHFRSLRIPSRDPAAPAHLIDLTRHYTHSLDMSPNQELEALPRGLQELGGSWFDLRGMVVLEALDQKWWGPLIATRGLEVRRRCRQLQFLQGVAGGGPPDGEELARWVVHYSDGSKKEWPVLYGEQVRDFWHGKDAPTEANQAVIVWEAHAKIPASRGADSVRLFKATWTNPQPEIEITHLDFILGKTTMHPFVVAITAE